MRRRALAGFGLVTLLAAVAIGVGSTDRSGAARRAEQPNVLLIITDDQRMRGSMAIMKRTRRKLVERGTKYSRAFVSTPFCCPSRASIFSGKFPHNHGIVANDGTGFDAEQTWQAKLDEAGYFTGIYGKYLNLVSARQAPHFDRRETIPPGDPRDPELIAAGARRFLAEAETQDRSPWALVLATMSPHSPFNSIPADPKPLPGWEPPRSVHEDLSDKHPAVAEAAARYQRFGPDYGRQLRRGQLLELKRLDHSLGAVLDLVKRHGERRDTLVVFISDNGFLWGEHGVYAKLWPYLDSVRVPLVISWPGHVAKGAHTRRLAMNIDIAPTILDAANVAPGYPIDGRSLLGKDRHPWLFLESARDVSHRVPDWQAVFDGEHHYIEWSNGFVENYSLGRDRREERASNVPDPELEATLAAGAACAGSNCP